MSFPYKIVYLNLQMRYLCAEFKRSPLKFHPKYLVHMCSRIACICVSMCVPIQPFVYQSHSSDTHKQSIHWNILTVFLCFVSCCVIISYCIHMNSINPYSEDHFTGTGAVTWFLQSNWALVNIVAADVLVFWYSQKLLNTCIIHYSIYGCVCFQFTLFLRDGWDNILLCLIIIIKSEVWTIIHCLGLGHE